jgi:tetratricopeptide (TPR) repeat protein
MVTPTRNLEMKAVRWILGIILWFAALGEKIILWSLRHWAYFLVVPCLALLLLTKWVAFTLSKQIQGLHLSILGYAPGHHVNPLLSFGFIAAVLVLLAAVLYSRRHWRLLAICGTILLSVTLFASLQVAFLHSGLLKELLDEEIQAKGAADFTKKYLPTNSGNEASDAIGFKGLPTDTVWQRFVAAWYFMGFGWYVAIVFGFAAFFCGIARTPKTGHRLALSTLSIMAMCALAMAGSGRSLLAHLAFVRGQQAESKGNLQGAITQYREAIRLDGWYAINTDVYQRLGAIDSALGSTNTFEYRIYHAELMLSENDYPAAIAEYERVLETEGKDTRFLRSRTFEIINLYGTQLYQAGAIGSAVVAWQSVLALAPDQWLAVYCLSTAYFDTGRYQESIDLIEGLLKGLADPQLRANLNSNMGDAYTRLGDYQHAHLAYRYSYFVDNILNWRALMSLVGS